MKNKKISVIVLVLVVLLTSGCGSKDYIQDKDKKIITTKATGQNLPKEIYCKPSKDTEVYKLYEKHEKQMKVKLSNLPECRNFKVTSNKTTSLWQLVFVKPLAYLILKLGYVFKNMGLTKSYLGLSLMIIGLIIRLIILPFNIKTQKQSKKLQEAAPALKRIEKKYEGKTDQVSMMAKAQETQAVYQKYHVNPMLSCLLALIQLPVFFAFLQAIYKIPEIYEGKIFGLSLGMTPYVGIFKNHQYSYLVLVILIILTTYFSFKYTMSKNATAQNDNQAADQMKFMLMFMTVFIGFASFSLPTAIALYWIVTYAFIVIQTFIMNLIDKKKENKNSTYRPKEKKIKDKLKVKEGLKYGKNK